jgi:hypothetical protein
VAEIRRYFEGKGIVYYGNELLYSCARREEYFKRCTQRSTEDRAHFFDPDIGLQWGSLPYMRDQGIDKYLFDDSVRGIAGRSTADSVLIVYQHLQRNRVRSPSDLKERTQRLQQLVNPDFSVYLSNREIAFLATTRNAELRDKLCEVIVAHGDKHALQYGAWRSGCPT